MAAARRRAWKREGREARSLTGGLQLEPWPWQGTCGGTQREKNGKRAGPSKQIVKAAMDPTPCPHGETARDRTYLGSTHHRSNSSEMSCHIPAFTTPPLKNLFFPPPWTALSLRLTRAWETQTFSEQCPRSGKAGAPAGGTPTQSCVRGWHWAVLPVGPPSLRQPPLCPPLLRFCPPPPLLRHSPRPPPTLRNWHSRTRKTNATMSETSRNASKMAAL